MNKGKNELKKLESEICKIISTRKTSKEKAELIWEIITDFKYQRMIEIDNIQIKIYALGKKSIKANDFELQKLDMEMNILLMRLFKITHQKNRLGEIVKSIPSIILEHVKEFENQHKTEMNDEH